MSMALSFINNWYGVCLFELTESLYIFSLPTYCRVWPGYVLGDGDGTYKKRHSKPKLLMGTVQWTEEVATDSSPGYEYSGSLFYLAAYCGFFKIYVNFIDMKGPWRSLNSKFA